MTANVPAITADLDALITDGLVHTRTDCLATIAPHGGFARHFTMWRQSAKDRGIHVTDAWDSTAGEWTYWEADSPVKADAAVANALLRRTIPEHKRHLRADRGEREVARLHGRTLTSWDRTIAQQEAMLSSLALRANMVPSAVLADTFLDPAALAAIAADVAAGVR